MKKVIVLISLILLSALIGFLTYNYLLHYAENRMIDITDNNAYEWIKYNNTNTWSLKVTYKDDIEKNIVRYVSNYFIKDHENIYYINDKMDLITNSVVYPIYEADKYGALSIQRDNLFFYSGGVAFALLFIAFVITYIIYYTIRDKKRIQMKKEEREKEEQNISKIKKILLQDEIVNNLMREFLRVRTLIDNNILNSEHETYKEYASEAEMQDFELNPQREFIKKFDIIVSNKLLEEIKDKLNKCSQIEIYKTKLYEIEKRLKTYIIENQKNLILDIPYHKINLINYDISKINVNELYFDIYIMIPRNLSKIINNYSRQGYRINNYDNFNKVIRENKIWLTDLYSYVEKQLNKNKSKLDQRKLMTPQLRKAVLERDDYTCVQCGANIYDEPNLLLEVDHKIPVSKGGITELNNLQTLCWKCNRSKSAKV